MFPKIWSEILSPDFASYSFAFLFPLTQIHPRIARSASWIQQLIRQTYGIAQDLCPQWWLSYLQTVSIFRRSSRLMMLSHPCKATSGRVHSVSAQSLCDVRFVCSWWNRRCHCSPLFWAHLITLFRWLVPQQTNSVSNPCFFCISVGWLNKQYTSRINPLVTSLVMSPHSCGTWRCTHSTCSKRVKHFWIHFRIHSSWVRRFKISRRLRIKSYHAECLESAFLNTSSFVQFNKIESTGVRRGKCPRRFCIITFPVCKMCHVSVRLSRLGRLIEGQSFAFAWRFRRIFWSLFWLSPTMWFDLFEKQICKYERFSYSVSPDEKKSP